MLIGLLIGVISGAVQFWLLAKFSRAMTNDGLDKKALLIGICQFLIPFLVLALCAILLDDALIPAIIGMTLTLSVFLIARHFISNMK